jgi:Maltokinase N-terminal cap domain
MAILHKATLTPSKPDLVAAWLDRQPWSGEGEVGVVGSYRFDDPAGEVGVEGFVVRRGGRVLHVPLTYRASPRADGESSLVGTLQHSVLGERWVYDATGDPVAIGCFVRALRGEQSQAEMELWDGDTFVGRREPTVVVRREAGRPDGAAPADADAVAIQADGVELRVVRMIGTELDGAHRLVAEWADGQGVIAALA